MEADSSQSGACMRVKINYDCVIIVYTIYNLPRDTQSYNNGNPPHRYTPPYIGATYVAGFLFKYVRVQGCRGHTRRTSLHARPHPQLVYQRL